MLTKKKSYIKPIILLLLFAKVSIGLSQKKIKEQDSLVNLDSINPSVEAIELSWGSLPKFTKVINRTKYEYLNLELIYIDNIKLSKLKNGLIKYDSVGDSGNLIYTKTYSIYIDKHIKYWLFDSFYRQNPSDTMPYYKETVTFSLTLVKHGFFLKYYQNGEFKIKGKYNMDKRNGTWKYYNKYGKLIRKEKWKFGILKKIIQKYPPLFQACRNATTRYWPKQMRME